MSNATPIVGDSLRTLPTLWPPAVGRWGPVALGVSVSFTCGAAVADGGDFGAWAPLGGGIPTPMNQHDLGVRALAIFDDGWGDGPALYAVGKFVIPAAGGGSATSIARWGGSEWHGVGDLTTNGQIPGHVQVLGVLPTPEGDRLIVGGGFNQAGGQPIGGFAAWDGKTWSDVGGGVPSAFTTDMHIVEDPTSPIGWSMYVIGANLTVLPWGSWETRGVWRYDGEEWSLVGPAIIDTALSGQRTRVRIHDGGDGPRVWVSGRALESDGVALGNVARLEGDKWVSVGGVVPDSTIDALHSLAFRGQQMLLVQGVVRRDGDPDPQGVLVHAPWSEAGWVRLGNGLDAIISINNLSMARRSTIAVVDDGVGGEAMYVSGAFSLAGGTPAQRIARWNGAFWSDLDGGIGVAPVAPAEEWSNGNLAGGFSVVTSIVADPFAPPEAPRVIVAGAFTHAGRDAIESIAAWSPDPDPRPGPFPFRCEVDMAFPPAFPGTVRGINTHGTFVGDHQGVGFIANADAVVFVKSPFGNESVSLRGINDDGIVTGTLVVPTQSKGFRLDSNTMTWELIGTLTAPCQDCGGYTIGNDGTIHGRDWNLEQAAVTHAVHTTRTSLTVPSPDGFTSPTPFAANAHGEAVGWIRETSPQRPYHFDGTKVVVLAHPEDVWSRAIDINDAGTIVGETLGSGAVGLLWIDGELSVLPGLNGGSTTPYGIANDGVIVGWSGGQHVFVIDDEVVPMYPMWSWRWRTRVGGGMWRPDDGRLLVGWSPRPGTDESNRILLTPRDPRVGDIDGDCIVDGYDLGILLAEWGRTDSVADLDGDGIVDGADLGLLLMSWTR